MLSPVFFKQANVKEINKRIASLRKRARREQISAQRSGYSAFKVTLSIAVYILSGHDLTIAAAFLRQQRKHEPAESDDFLQGLVAQWYLDSHELFEAGVFDPSTEAEKKLRRDALEWLAEYQTYCWILQQNVLGMAPANMQMLGEFMERCRALGAEHQATAAEHLQHQQGRGARKWSHRFRQKWNIRMGKLNTREPSSPSEVTDKAGA